VGLLEATVGAILMGGTSSGAAVKSAIETGLGGGLLLGRPSAGHVVAHASASFLSPVGGMRQDRLHRESDAVSKPNIRPRLTRRARASGAGCPRSWWIALDRYLVVRLMPARWFIPSTPGSGHAKGHRPHRALGGAFFCGGPPPCRAAAPSTSGKEHRYQRPDPEA